MPRWVSAVAAIAPPPRTPRRPPPGIRRRGHPRDPRPDRATRRPGYVLKLVRVTFAPGAAVAAHRHSGGTVTTQVSGSHAFTVLQGNARIIRAGSATPPAGTEAGEPMEPGREYAINLSDVMIFDEMVVHTAHNPNSEPTVLMEAQLRAVAQPLTEFVPELATPVG